MFQIPPEILKKVKLLEISTRKVVNTIFAGEYHTAFKGQGMTFSDFREYVPGDDVRTISWALTARAGKPYIKKFDEEREMSVLLMVDISGSQEYGSAKNFKGEIVNYLCALIAFSAQKNKDQVGLLLFTDQVEHFVPPAKGRGHVHRILRDLFFVKPKRTGTKMSAAFDYVQSALKKRATVFVISDFLDESFESSLKLLGKKHDVTAVVVRDPTEVVFPDLGLMDLEDAETGELVTVDTSSKSFQEHYKKWMKTKTEQRNKLLRRAQVALVEVNTKDDIVAPLVQFFRRRSR